MIYQRRWANKFLTPKVTHSEEDRKRKYVDQGQIKGKIETVIKLKKLKDWLLVRWLNLRQIPLSLVLDQSINSTLGIWS